MGQLLPSQRHKLAGLYREVAKTYRAGFAHTGLEGYARVAEMMADTFERGRDEPITGDRNVLIRPE